MTLALVLLAWVLLAGTVVQTMRLAAVWRRGATARVDWIAGLLALPSRYLVDVHAVVDRRPGAARMHQAIAGGLLAASALLVLGAIPALRGLAVYWVLVLLAFAVSIMGSVLVARRRRPVRPASLSGGAFNRLPVHLGSYAVGGFLAALGILSGLAILWVVGFVLAAWGGAMLVNGILTGPMRHTVAGALHLAVHPRQSRFAGEAASDLKPLPDGMFGAARVEDFAWNRLLGFDACIQCGRCEESCPAFASGQPLNPKALIQDLCAAMRPSEGVSYAGSPHPGLVGSGAVLGTIHPETLWSCTTCRACVASCPMMIEHVDAVIDMRRDLTLSHGAAPGKADAVLGELRHTGNSGGFSPERRLDFAAGSKLRVLGEGDATDLLLWLGDGAFDRRYGQTLRALVAIMETAGLDFAVLGTNESDCGDVARRLGDEAGFAALAQANVAILAARRFRRIVTADPHALHVLRREYPAFGGHYDVVHHTALIDELIGDGRLRLERSDTAITYHDPCYLGRYNGETEAPRRILAHLTSEMAEMERHGRTSFCCGGGGGAPVTDIPGKSRIPDLRMDQARDTGAAIVAVACPGCTSMLEGVVGQRPIVRDIAELVHEAMVAPARAAVNA